MPIKFSLLHADKDTKALKTLPALFQSQYLIYTATSPAECREILKEHEIHLMILDQSIVGMAGEDFLEKVLLGYQKTIKILTGTNDNVDFLIHAMNSGNVYRYIPKPWDEKAFKKTIQHALKSYVERQKDETDIVDFKYIIDELNFLHKISQKISEKKPLPVLLNEIMESSKLLMHAEASSLLLYEPEDNKLHFQVATGEKGKLIKKYSVDVGEGIAGWVAEHQKPLLVKDCYEDPRFNPEYDKKTDFRTKSMICVPLIRKNQLLGVIQVINKREAEQFEERDLTIFETLASQCAIAIENHRLTEIQIETEALERELETAREIQQKLLPTSLPEYEDIQVAAELIPAKQVGGDYYNIIRVDENQSLFFVADVTGKGIPAALIVSTITSCLTSYFKMLTCPFELMTLVQGLNRVLIESTTETKFATCWFGLYEHDSRKLISVNAGHNPPYVFRRQGKEPVVLGKGGLFLGGLDVPYESEEVKLRSGDVLVFFTDGVTEAWNLKEEEYEEKRLIRVVSENMGRQADEILNAIETDVQKHVGKAQQSDDFTCAVVKVM